VSTPFNVDISNQWRPRDFWKLVLWLATAALLLSPLFWIWHIATQEPQAMNSWMVGYYSCLVQGIAVWRASGIRELRQFKPTFGLGHLNGEQFLIAFAIGFLLNAGTYWISRVEITPEYDLSFGPLAAWALLAPFVEEIEMRGFLYKAFRNGYSAILSVTLVVAANLMLHWCQVSTSVIIFLSNSSLNIVTCIIREKTQSLWNCIGCHFAYNLFYVAILWRNASVS
jgi:membrane protease YdiL (CAAX protease family)